jgi:hypothetical protein
MKLPKAYLNHVNKLVTLFQAKMLLMDYELKIKQTELLTSPRYRDGSSAEVETDTRYLEARITLSGKFLKKWRNKEWRELAQTVAHELSHIYTDPYYELFWDLIPKKNRKQLEHINEQQTERIARLVMLNVRPKDYLP